MTKDEKVKRRMGMLDTKTYCGCTTRGKFIDASGKTVRKRMHRLTCKYHKKHVQHRI